MSSSSSSSNDRWRKRKNRPRGVNSEKQVCYYESLDEEDAIKPKHQEIPVANEEKPKVGTVAQLQNSMQTLFNSILGRKIRKPQ